MSLSFAQLRIDHNRGLRPVPIAPLRDAFAEIGWRRWGTWRFLAECPHRAQKISRLSAIKIWLLAVSHGQLDGKNLTTAIKQLIHQDGDRLEQWLQAIEWQSAARPEQMMAAINAFNPAIDVIHRQRLYDWFDRAGMRYSVSQPYSHRQVAEVAAIAGQTVGLGRRRRR